MLSDRQRLYLAYGSNLHPRRLEARIGSVDPIATVELPGWALRFEKRGGDGSAKANLHACPGSRFVAQAAVFSLSPAQVSRLDVFEGCGRGYETLSFTIDLQGEQCQAFTYIAPSQWIARNLQPFDWYVDLIVSGALFHGFNESYVQQIARQPACVDPDQGRARRELRDMNLPLRSHYKP